MILASFGLGSFTLSVWFAKYRWLFLIATLVFLGLAFFMTYRDRKKTNPWNIGILVGTTLVSIGFIIYSLIVN